MKKVSILICGILFFSACGKISDLFHTHNSNGDIIIGGGGSGGGTSGGSGSTGGGSNPSNPSGYTPKTIQFSIPNGTADGEWNPGSVLEAKKGDTLVIKNDDSEPHYLHTNGAPVPHGNMQIPAGGSMSLVLTKTYAASSKSVYDHESGTNALFNINVTNP